MHGGHQCARVGQQLALGHVVPAGRVYEGGQKQGPTQAKASHHGSETEEWMLARLGAALFIGPAMRGIFHNLV